MCWQPCRLRPLCTVPSQGTRVFSVTGSVPASQIRPRQPCLSLSIITGIKKAFIHELDQIRSMPFLCQSLFGHQDTPPFWCQREWRAAADFAITCNKRPHLTGRPFPRWRIPKPLAPMRSWHCPPTLQTVQFCQPEVHSPRQHSVVPKWSCRTRQCPLTPKCSMSTRQA